MVQTDLFLLCGVRRRIDLAEVQEDPRDSAEVEKEKELPGSEGKGAAKQSPDRHSLLDRASLLLVLAAVNLPLPPSKARGSLVDSARPTV